MYKLHSLQYPDWYRTGTSYCYFYIFEIIYHHSGFFSKTYPSFLTVKEGSTFLTKPLFPQGREDVTALRCSEPLRYKVGGPSKVFAILCGMGPPGEKTKYLERQVINGKSPYLLFRNLHIL